MTILTDTYNRKHTYLRLSITERCNLRCTYCMPFEGIALSPKSEIMSCDEIYTIAKTFVKYGVKKIRLTGGEPLVRKDFKTVIEKLATLPVKLAITTNAVAIAHHIKTLKENNILDINISLDSLNIEKFKTITRRNYFKKVYDNIIKLVQEDFNVKINIVLIKGFNNNEIINFIELTKTLPVTIRFIEFMPFDGNQWSLNKMVSLNEILKTVKNNYLKTKVLRIKDSDNDTSKNYKIKGYKGSFAIISSVTNPFCDSCNRLRITANGHLKNCLFSEQESDLLSLIRKGKPINKIIYNTIQLKSKIRGGMNTIEKLKEPQLHSKNRSMIAIGG